MRCEGVLGFLREIYAESYRYAGACGFHYEVSRSLAAVEGRDSLVDATKGCAGADAHNLYLAIEEGLEIIPVINKVDLPAANVEKTKKRDSSCAWLSRRGYSLGVREDRSRCFEILRAVVERVPAPRGE